MRTTGFVAVASVVVLLCACASASAGIEIEACQLPMDEALIRGRADFNIIYRFRVDKAGRPSEIKKVTDRFVGQSVVSRCLSRWKLTGVDSEGEVVVVFRWKHGVGWDRLVIKGEGLDIKITLSGDRCAYCP